MGDPGQKDKRTKASTLDCRGLRYRVAPHPDPDDADLVERLVKWPSFARYLVAELEREAGINRETSARVVRAAWHNAGGGQ
jgi:hypothetical protein